MKIVNLLAFLLIQSESALKLKISRSQEPLLIQQPKNSKIVSISPIRNYQVGDFDDSMFEHTKKDALMQEIQNQEQSHNPDASPQPSAPSSDPALSHVESVDPASQQPQAKGDPFIEGLHDLVEGFSGMSFKNNPLGINQEALMQMISELNQGLRKQYTGKILLDPRLVRVILQYMKAFKQIKHEEQGQFHGLKEESKITQS